jgi:(E)-4-hydroxy-3-methylbut-2-enyl-diphosphate synthase
MDENARRDAAARGSRGRCARRWSQSALQLAPNARRAAACRTIASSCRLQGQRRAGPDRRSIARWPRRCDYCRCTSGLTEAGMGTKGIVATAAALGAAAARASATPSARVAHAACRARRSDQGGAWSRQQILQSLGLRHFTPQRHGLPGLRPHHQHVRSRNWRHA